MDGSQQKEEDILHVTCQDHPASAGGCKHAPTFLMWMHEKSNQPAPTEVDCYWKKPKLSGIGSTLKFTTVDDFGAKKSHDVPGASTFLKEFVAIIQPINSRPISQMLKYYQKPNKFTDLSMHRLIFLFVKKQVVSSVSDFLSYASTIMQDYLCSEGEKATRMQADGELWHDLCYGRITASKLYAAAQCNMAEGALVEQILRPVKLNPSRCMIRGQVLESEVLQELQNNLQRF
ncbi:hypothetical protein FQA39_LY16284 [Lamprigera yunnana]|nr:hypothetical protein FQA39_LY16284 [Lamprigera yunnana]